jgi:hypothetical protein
MALTEEERKERRRVNRHNRYIENKEKELARSKAWREANLDKIREYDRNRTMTKKRRNQRADWAKKNKEHVKAFAAEYYITNKAAIRAKHAEWKKVNREKVITRNMQYFKEQRKSLSDTYVSSLLTQKTVMKNKDIPQSLIQAKRAEIKLTRLIKDQ